MRFCEKLNVEYIDVDYDPINWFERVKGLEWEPEKVPVALIFDMRFERTALYAHENNFEVT